MPTDRIVIGTEAILELAVIVDPSALDDHTSIIGGVSQALYGEGTGSHLLGGRISIAPLGTHSLPTGSGLVSNQIEDTVVSHHQTGTGESSAASASHGVVSLHLIGVAGSGNNGTPVNHGLTGLAVGSAGVACGIAGSGNVGQGGQLSIMVVPRIDVVIQVGNHGDGTAESTQRILVIVAHELDRAGEHLAINGNDGAIPGRKLSLGSNGLASDIIDTVPTPQTDRDAEQSGSGSINGGAVSLDGHSQNAFYLVDAVGSLEAVGNDHALRLPGVGILKLQLSGQLVDGVHVGNLNVYVVNRVIFSGLAGVIVTAQRDHGITGNREGSGDLVGITHCVLDLKSNRMDAGVKSYVLTGKYLAGGSYIGQSNTVHGNLAGGIVQLDVVGNGSGESDGVAGDGGTLVQSDRLISGGVADVADRRQYSVIHSGAVVQGNVINVEGVNSGSRRLDIRTDERRRTGVALIGSYGSTEIIVTGNIDGSVYPARLGNIGLSAGVQILSGTADSDKREVILLAGVSTICVLGIKLGLEGQPGSAFGNVQPHTQGGSILAVGYVTKDDGFAHVEQDVVAPVCKSRIGKVLRPCQRVLAVSDNIRGNESGTVDLLVELAVQRSTANQRVIHAVLLAPLFGIGKAHKACGIAIFKVINDFGTLAVGHLQNVGHCGIGLISGSYVNTGDTFVGSRGQRVAVQGSGGIIGQCQGISTIHANSPVVNTVGAGEVKGHALAVGEYSFILSKCEDVGINHSNVSLTHYLVIVNQLDLGHALLAGGHELAGLDGTEGSVSHLPGSTLGNGSGSVSSVNTGCGELQGRAGSHVIIVSVQNSFVELAGSLDLGNQDHAVDGRTLGAVGGDRTHDVIDIAGALGHEGGGSAAVAVDCVHATQSQHHLTHLVVGKTTGGGGVTTVNLTEDQGTVSLDTDHGAGSVGRCTLNSFGLKYAVLNQPTEVSGNGSLLIAGQRGAHGTKLTTTVLVDGQVGLRALMNFRSAENHAVPNHVTIGSVGVVSQGGIHSTDHVVAQGLIVSHGLGQLHSLPVLRLISNAFQGQIVGIQLVNAVVTGENLDHLVGRVYLKGVNDLTVITVCVVEDHLYLGDAGGELIDLFGNFFKIVVGYCCVIIPRGGQSRDGHHGDTQQYC